MRIFASRRPECRLCTHVLCGCRWGACGMCYVCCIGEAVWCWLYSSHDAPLCCHPQLPSPSPKNAVVSTSIWVELSECVTYGLYLVPMVCNDISRDIAEYVHTYVHTYILCENRSSIQSLMLMRSATRGTYAKVSRQYFISNSAILSNNYVALQMKPWLFSDRF